MPSKQGTFFVVNDKASFVYLKNHHIAFLQGKSIMTACENVKIAFIGFGNMASAMADGFIRSGKIRPEQLGASALHYEALVKKTASRGIKAFKTNKEAASWADIIILAVKPDVVGRVVESVKEILADKIVLSVAVNILFDAYEEMLEQGTEHLSLLPNTPVCVNEGVLLCEAQHNLKSKNKKLVDSLLSLLGLVLESDTSKMKAAGVISGCGPAYVAMFIEALADGAVLHGVPRETALKLASQTLAGTARLQLATGFHPGAMKDAVCSPGGTTIVGVASLEESGFRGSVIRAVDTVLTR